MKIIITIHLLLLSILLESCRQGTAVLPYMPLSAFSGDTLAYLMYNFEDRKSLYSGKCLDTLLRDLEIPIKSAIPGSDPNNISICPGILFSFEDDQTTSTKLHNKNKMFFIDMDFDPALDNYALYNIIHGGCMDFCPALKDFLDSKTIGGPTVSMSPKKLENAEMASRLSDLKASTGDLTTGFSANLFNYTIYTDKSSITFIPYAAKTTNTIMVNDIEVASGRKSQVINLNSTNNTVQIAVTCADGTLTKTYYVNIVKTRK